MISAIENDTLSLTFGAPWSLEDHAAFLRSKALPEAQIVFDRESDTYEVRAPARFAPLMGLAAPAPSRERLPYPPHPFDYQLFVLDLALRAKRFAVWADCGLGKDAVIIPEWCRQVAHITAGPVLILTVNAAVSQQIEEIERFYGGSMTCRRLNSRDEIAAFCRSGRQGVAISNHEKLSDGVIPEMRHLAGLAVNESSILKSGGGVIKWNLIKSAKGIEWKLSATATPAPNDTMEYASQASFLEKLRSEGEILWTYFARDPRTQAWKVKPHAREAFYRFMSTWSIYLRKPAAYGFVDPFANIPEPAVIEHRIQPTPEQIAARDTVRGVRIDGELLPKERLGVTQRSKLSQIAKGFRYDGETAVDIPSLKPSTVGALVRRAATAGKQVLVWCIFDEEARIVGRHLKGVKGVAQLHGDTPEADRDRILQDFRAGKIRVLVGKAAMLGYGLNFPFVEEMVFSGFDDSFERFYQAVRRAYRYGAKNQLQVHLPYVPGLEDHIWENILRKKSQWDADTAECEKAYAAAFEGLRA